MDEIQALWTPRATQDGVRLMVSYDGDPDSGRLGDALRLKQVFNNLIGHGAAVRPQRRGRRPPQGRRPRDV